jgi:hypothetical protein
MRKMAHDDSLTYSIVNRKYDAKPFAGTIFLFTLKSRAFPPEFMQNMTLL